MDKLYLAEYQLSDTNPKPIPTRFRAAVVTLAAPSDDVAKIVARDFAYRLSAYSVLVSLRELDEDTAHGQPGTPQEDITPGLNVPGGK